MELSDPMSLVSGLFVGLIGMALFIFGKKQQRPPALLAGVVLSVLPMVVASAAILWGLTAACLGGLYLFGREG